jgi:hypothetical protein
MSLRNRESIFDSPSQFLKGVRASEIRVLEDRVICEDLPDPDKIGSLFVPESAGDRGVGGNGRFRLARVVAIGPGDKFIEKGLDAYGDVKREALGPCPECRNSPKPGFLRWRVSGGPDGPHGEWSDWETCYGCNGDGLARWPMYCKPGDVVIIERRREAEVYIEGVRYTIAHEQQAVIAVLDGFDLSSLDKA